MSCTVLGCENMSQSCHSHGVYFWQFAQKHVHQYPPGGHFVGLWWQCSSCSSSNKGYRCCCWVVALSHPCPTLLVYWSPPCFRKCTGRHTIPSLRACMDVLPEGDGLPVQPLGCRYCLMQKVVIRTLKSTKLGTKQSRRNKNKERAIVCGQHLQNHSHFVSCLAVAFPVLLFSLSFASNQVKLIHNYFCFLSGQLDIRFYFVCSWLGFGLRLDFSHGLILCLCSRFIVLPCTDESVYMRQNY